MRMTFFHKTPAMWNKTISLEIPSGRVQDLSMMKKNISSFSPNQEMLELFETDIYIQMCKHICKILEIEELHIVHGVSEKEEKNWITHDSEGYCKVDEMSTYWCVASPEKLLGFVDADIIFSRGNYPILHNWLHQTNDSNGRIWIHYPATSLRYPHLERYGKSTSKALHQKTSSSSLKTILTGMGVEHNMRSGTLLNDDLLEVLLAKFTEGRTHIFGGPYTIVLVDDNYNVDATSLVYPDSLIYKFVKPALWSLDEIPHTRSYDLIFCGTTLQSTKNHHAFGQLLEKLDTCTNRKLTIVIAGNNEKNDTLSTYLNYPYANLEIVNIGEVSRSELQSLFSNTKTMLITSGRDSNPRTIQESLVHGARVIAIDTLSDGLEFLKSNPLLGQVLTSDVEGWHYTRNGNLEFRPDMQLASQLMKEIDKSKFPDLVASVARNKLSLEESMNLLCRLITSLQ